MGRSVLALLAPLVFVAACGSDNTGTPPPPVPAEVASLSGSIGAMALAGGDLLCAVEKGGIVRVSTATGQVSAYAPDERVGSLVADAAHVAWVTSDKGPGVHELVKVAPVGDGSKPFTVADEKREIGSIAVDDGFVYWTTQTDVFPKVTYDVFRAPVSGGAATKLAEAVVSVSALGQDAQSLFFMSDDDLVSLPKTGGTPATILTNATGLGGAHQVIVDDANVTFIGNTGGGATSNFVAWAPKAPGGMKTSYAFPCQGVVGIAADGASVFATCNKDIEGFKTTTAFTIRKVAKTSTSIATIGQVPAADASSDMLGAIVVDATRAYAAYGNKVLAVAK